MTAPEALKRTPAFSKRAKTADGFSNADGGLWMADVSAGMKDR
jgi:hypothetical protein